DFTPRLVLEVSDDGLRWQPGPDPVGGVDLARPTVPNGTVVEVRNTGQAEHRVEGDTWFDTGTLQPGERTVGGLNKDTTEPKTIAIVDHDDRRRTATITVLASPPKT